MPECIILRGLPGSGKSTLARVLRGPEGVVFAADDYFSRPDGSWVFDPVMLGAAHAKCLRDFVCAIQAHAPRVIVDNTNSTNLEAAPYVQLSLAYGYNTRIVMVRHESVVSCAARTIHGVPLSTIQRMADNLEEALRTAPPYWPASEVYG